jgi:transcriptional repressor NrdR
MRCPYCSDTDNKVIDSRDSQEGTVIRRRRECEKCKQRFTTYERVEELLPALVKKDGRREPFDRDKVLAGLKKACEKRPVSAEQMDAVVTSIERKLQASGEKEVPTSMVGELVMSALAGVDQVAYVRFASVYRSFKDIGEFMHELQDLLHERSGASSPKSDKDAPR